MKAKTVLIVEDDVPLCSEIRRKLQDRGIKSIGVHDLSSALKEMKKSTREIGVALIDQRLPKKSGGRVGDSAHGKGEGLKLARLLRESYPQVRLIGMSNFAEEEVRDWFAEYGYAFLRKYWLTEGGAREFIDKIEQAARKPSRKRTPQCFIVHGHDSRSLNELLVFLDRNLGWPQPKILRDLPSYGRTIIEKFEETSQDIDIVFVLLTPDDKAAAVAAPNQIKRRARQNVIFELGYFYGKLQRVGGRVLLLHKGKVELPSDIAGVVYVDISDGVEAAGETLRRELGSWL
ncbi:MAG TPA: TIR domain-containing protein [Verrucomicrobiae bacterium]|nr:TIR domain-containing protein [Verrucomicrobiae bacterium]